MVTSNSETKVMPEATPDTKPGKTIGARGGIMGRPTKELDWKEFEQLCFLQCTVLEMLEWFHISEKTFYRRVKEHYGETFSSVFAKKRTGGKISLRRNLFKQSEKNPAVAIFLAKNWLAMSDKLELTGEGGGPLKQESYVKATIDPGEVAKAIMEAERLGITASNLGGNGHHEGTALLPAPTDVQTDTIPLSDN